MSSKKPFIPAVILAGGKGTRLGEVDKCLLQLNGKSILDTLVTRLTAQCSPILLNANGDKTRFKNFDGAIIPDISDSLLGPLSGIHSALVHLSKLQTNDKTSSNYLLSVPGDCPFIPDDLAAQLKTHANDQDLDVVTCKSGDREHFVVSLWKISLADKLNSFLDSGNRSVGQFIRSCDSGVVEFPINPIDPFFNINTPEDFEMAEQLLNSKH